MAKQSKIPISKRALMQRLNRRLAAEGEKLLTARGTQAMLDLGEFYTIDVGRNMICRKAVDPAALARQLGVLKPYEEVTE
jgi:hypothetical protein